MSGEPAHILNRHKIQAVLDRGSAYRENGVSTIAGDKGKLNRVYDNNDKIKTFLTSNMEEARKKGAKRLPTTTIEGASYGDDTHAGGYHFKHFDADNSGTPYPNQGHHMLPYELFLPRKEGGDPEAGGLFEHTEREILLRVKYDINNGNNIIFLPATLNYCGVHQLPYHVGSHPGYTRMVRDDLAQINEMLKAQAKKLCEEWNPPESIPRELKKTENEYWDWIVAFGESQAASINAFQKVVDTLTGKQSTRKLQKKK